jgi:hypothetical protein
MDSATDTNPRTPPQGTNLCRRLCKKQLCCNMLNRLVEGGGGGEAMDPLEVEEQQMEPRDEDNITC